MIAIIDYGVGNVKAFYDVYKKLNVPAIIVKEAKDLKHASKVILPGVGAFDNAMKMLEKSGMRQVLDEMVLHRKVPCLGVCVGMQMLGYSSDEGSIPGLGWLDGVVLRLNPSSLINPMWLPHMGWNNIKPLRANGLIQGIDLDARFYFLHSYFFKSQKDDNIIATTDYGGWFCCVVNSRNVFGVQFHPEKSHKHGVHLLNNFAYI